MKDISYEEVDEKVDLHELWLSSLADEGDMLVLKNYNLSGANLRGASLKYAQLGGARLASADLELADLRGTDLEGTDLVGANLSRANLRWAKLGGANLKGANLESAKVQCNSLRGTNLDGANLRGMDIRSTFGDGHRVKNIYGYEHHISYTATHLAIGCKMHPIEDWLEFSDKEIASMDGGALKWWDGNKDAIIECIEEDPAE